ncbi:MAG TPA: cytochrome b/b6 domain-containing protein [Campylobacterales bacterium]|nr:cytochrome b/b6 domain-containing protein [Campylobacterales bacterium]
MKYSKLLRLWHWLNALTIFILLATFFLRKTFLSWRTNSELIVQKLAEVDIEVTTEVAKTIAKAIRAPMWEWHIIFGYVLATLILFRIFIFIKEGMSYKNFSSLHKTGITLLYTLFYLLIFFMALSGITMHQGVDIGLSKELIHDIKEIHELTAWFFVFFVPAHIAGVVVADMTNETGLISRMVSGRKR